MTLSDALTRRPSRKSSLGDVLDAVGPPALQVVTPVAFRHLPVRATLLLDPTEALGNGPETLLLASGVVIGDDTTSQLIHDAARLGYCGIVLKRRGQQIDDLVETARTCSMALFIAADEIPWRHLDSLILSVLGSRGVDGEKDGNTGDDLFAIANATAGAIGGSVAIEDLDRRVLAYSSLPGQRMDDLRRQGILDRLVPAMERHLKQYAAVLDAPGVVRFSAAEVGTPRAAIAVRAGNQPLGTIWAIEGDGGLHSRGEQALVDAGRLAALQMLRRRNSSELGMQAREDALRAAIEGRLDVNDIAFRLSIPNGSSLVLMGFALTNVDDGAARLVQVAKALSGYFSLFHTEAAVATTSRAVYVVLLGENPELAVRLAAGAIGSMPKDLVEPLVAGISDMSLDPAQLPILRRDVDDVLRAAMSNPPISKVATLGDVRAEVLLTRVSDVFDRAGQLRHPGVEKLLLADQENRTSLATSVLVWLEAGGDVSRAAQALGIHANTLRYRIRRVQEVFDIQLNDPDTRLHAWIQLRTCIPRTNRDPSSVSV